MSAVVVKDAVARAAKAAFDLGKQQGRKGGTGRPDAMQLELAQLYADQLVMPAVEAALDQAITAGIAAARRGTGGDAS